MMTCHEMDERIEAIAAGDEPASDAFRAHVEACVRCAAALAQARRVEQALAARPVPSAPPRFAALIASRIRREHWRSEQQVDWFFNLAIAAGLIAIAGGTLALVNLGAVTDGISAGLVALNALAIEQGGAVATQAAPAFSTYLLGGGFLVTAVLVWSWAERSGRSE
jgi:anti-sigma factor RsiW